ncbi:MAG: Mechanosensitive channel MscK [Candidatus Marinimicrobia bacterium]|nr:Mechanosensitive channel MscK [Candidatus Neomarinimicrobiota bacterium]
MRFLKLILFLAVIPVFLEAQSPLSRTNLMQQSAISQGDSVVSGTTSNIVRINRESFERRFDRLQERYAQLFERDEVAISSKTFTNLWKDLRGFVQGDAQIIQDFKAILLQYVTSWNHALNLLIAMLIVIALVYVFKPLKGALAEAKSRSHESDLLALNTLGHVVDVAIRALPTVIIMFGVWLIALVLNLPSDLYYAILRIAAAIVVYKLVRWFLEVVFAPEEVHHRLVPCNTKIARYFFYISRALLQWTLLYTIVLFVLQYIEYRADFLYFIKYVYRIGAILLFAMLFAKRDFTLALFPTSEIKFYHSLRNAFSHIYYLIYGLLLFTGVLSILGYSSLSGFIFSRTFYTAAAILLGILLNRILYDAINWMIPEQKREIEEGVEDQKSARFWDRLHTLTQFVASAIIILLGVIIIAKSWWLLGRQSVWDSLISLVTFSLFEVQGTPITPWSLIKAILIFAAFIYASKYLRRFLDAKVLQKTSLDRGARHAILTITNYLIIVVGLVVAMESVGIRLTTLKVFAGALGLGIGFGLQNIANNFASGLIILFERPIKTKDFVHVGDILGTVTKISARSTTILTRDNIAIIVPNSDFIEKTVINWSLDDTPTRVHIPIGVEYGTDVEKVKEILLEIAEQHPRVLKYPRSRVWFKEFGDSALDFELLSWINDPQKGINNIKSDINFEINKRFKEEGIGIPFPQRDVHFKMNDEDITNFRKLLSSSSKSEDEPDKGADIKEVSEKDENGE